jgi:UDP-glucose 4-epimerase
MRVLVTGGAGFLGSHLVERLVGLGHHVTVFDNFSTGHRGNLAGAVAQVVDGRTPGLLSVVDGDVRNASSVDLACRLAQPDTVYHLAAQIDVRTSVEHPVGDAEVNVLGTVRMLQAAAGTGVSRFVFTSSAATLWQTSPGQVASPLAEAAPISPYGVAKAAGELYVEQFGRLYGTADPTEGLTTATAVLSNLYGPRQQANFGAVNRFARALLAAEDVVLYGDGSNIRDYLYVDDAVDALLWLGGLHPSWAPRTHHLDVGRTLVGTGVGTTDAELLYIVATAVGETPTIRRAPARSCDIRRMVLPGGGPRTKLQDGVARTVAAIRKEMGL